MMEIDWRSLARPMSEADDALARLDERMAGPLGAGLRARFDIHDSIAALANEAALIHFEDLVLHDEQMDIIAPTHELLRAANVLETRRKAAGRRPEDLMTLAGLKGLVGAWEPREWQKITTEAPPKSSSSYVSELLAFADSLTSGEDDEAEHDEPNAPDHAFDEWTAEIKKFSGYPPVLAAAMVMVAWRKIDPIPRCKWLGPLLAGTHLRKEGRARFLLPIHVGYRAARRRDIKQEPLAMAVDAIRLAALDGLETHKRLKQTQERLLRMVAGKRGRFEDMVALLIDRPLVTIPLIVEKMKITKQAAAHLMNGLAPIPREMTGRDRYRAWGV